jgi:hypothetical protein
VLGAAASLGLACAGVDGVGSATGGVSRCNDVSLAMRRMTATNGEGSGFARRRSCALRLTWPGATASDWVCVAGMNRCWLRRRGSLGSSLIGSLPSCNRSGRGQLAHLGEL